MKKPYFAGLVAVTIFLTGCYHENTARIANGVYREPTGVEAVTVQGRQITLQLNITKGLQLGVRSGQYNYDLESNGQLALSGSSNDEFFLFAVIRYKWLWDGKNVIRKDKDTGVTTVFARD